MTILNKNKSNSTLYDISLRIKYYRKKKNLTQKRLADLVGVNKTTICGYENDVSFPSLEVLILLSQIFDVSSDELLGITKKNNGSENNLLNIRELTITQKKIVTDLVNEFTKQNDRV
ncbi:MAG: helix-turn-helix domain-containing protein [Lachnospirales bacterium]